MTFIPWPSDKVDAVWPLVEPLLAPAIARNDGYLPEDVRAAIEAQQMQLFVVADEDNNVKAAVVSMIINYPRKKTAFVLFMGGRDMKLWADTARDSFRKWAVAMGCDDIESIGRPGFKRVFPAEPKGLELYVDKLGGQ